MRIWSNSSFSSYAYSKQDGRFGSHMYQNTRSASAGEFGLECISWVWTTRGTRHVHGEQQSIEGT